jgi:hypothetical protein
MVPKQVKLHPLAGATISVPSVGQRAKLKQVQHEKSGSFSKKTSSP